MEAVADNRPVLADEGVQYHSLPHLERVDRQGAKGVIYLDLLCLFANGMDGGLSDLFVELGVAVQAFQREVDKGRSFVGRLGESRGMAPGLGGAIEVKSLGRLVLFAIVGLKIVEKEGCGISARDLLAWEPTLLLELGRVPVAAVTAPPVRAEELTGDCDTVLGIRGLACKDF